MPSNWTMYGDFLDAGSPLFNTQAEAMDYYFVKTAQIAPYTAACKNYFATQVGWNPYRSARRANGVWLFDCSVSPTDYAKTGAYAIAYQHGCTPKATNPSCFKNYDKATGKNVGAPKCTGTVSCGNPINPGTGNKYQQEIDFVVEGSPWLNFVRHYNSSGAAAPSAALGPKWRHAFEYRIVAGTSGALSLFRPDGSVKFFSGAMGADAEERGYLDPILDTQGNTTGWVYDSGEGSTETYDQSGRITRIDWLAGGFLNFGYAANSLNLASVTDHFGRAVTFTYSGTRLTRVTAPDGGQYNYAYAGSGASSLLASMTAPGLAARQFKYDESDLDATSTPGHLTGIIDASGTRYATFKYDFRERGIFSEHAGGVGRFTVAYSDTGPTVVTTPLGATQSLTFASSLGVPRLVSSALQCGDTACMAPSVITYDQNGNATSRSEGDGTKTCTAYDLTRNLPTVQVQGVAQAADCASAIQSPPAGTRTTTITWHPVFRVPTLVVSPGLNVELAYDNTGRVTSTTAQASDAGARTVGLAYNAMGQLLSVDGPRTNVNDVTSYEYSANGNLASVTDAKGAITSFSGHDGNGRPGQMTLPNGATVALQYNARGQVLSSTVAGLLTSYTYDSRGLLASVSTPDGRTLTYGYDAAHRLTSVTDQRGNQQQLSLNAAGGASQASVMAAGGLVVTQLNQTFDALNRVLQKTGAHVVDPTAVLLKP